MTSAAAVRQAVEQAVEAAPAPADVTALDAQTRRAVDRAATLAGISPAEFWQRARAVAAATTVDDDEVRRVVTTIRHR